MVMHAVPGPFEQAILCELMRGESYGNLLKDVLTKQLGRQASTGAVYTTLERMEAKGYISSSKYGLVHRRGGRTKRYYKIEEPGKRALAAALAAAQRMLNNPVLDELVAQAQELNMGY